MIARSRWMKLCLSEKRKSRHYRNASLIPQTDTRKPFHQENDTLDPTQSPTSKSLQTGFLQYVPSRFQYRQTVDDLPVPAKASNDDDNDIDEPFLGNLSHPQDTAPHNKCPRRRHNWIHRHQEPLADEEDNFAVSMSAFLIGYRAADANRYADIAKFIKEWDGAWDKISRKPRIEEKMQKQNKCNWQA